MENEVGSGSSCRRRTVRPPAPPARPTARRCGSWRRPRPRRRPRPWSAGLDGARGPAHAAAIDPAVGDVGQPHGGPGQRAHGAGAELHAQHAQRRDVGQAGSAAGDFDGRHEADIGGDAPGQRGQRQVVAAQAQREPTDHVGQRRAGGHGQQDGQRRRYAIVARQDGRGRRRRPGRRRGPATAGRRPAGRPGPGRPGRWCRPASSGPRSRSAAARSARRPRGRAGK